MQHPLDCPHCHQHTHLVAPAAWTRGFVALAWVVVAAMVFMAGMIGPFIMLVLPFLAACGMGLISGAHALAGESVANRPFPTHLRLGATTARPPAGT